MDFAEESPIAAFLLRARREGLRDFGACLSPMNAFQILQGIETLGLRMERHVANARALVAHLEAPLVEAVSWPELDSHPDHALAARLLPKGCGGVFSFSLKGGRKAGCAFIEGLRLFSTWPMWAMPSRWRSTRPAPPTSACRRRRCWPPASAKAPSACRSASKRPT
jgi:O-acetylhomoserine (thiol)-lyase